MYSSAHNTLRVEQLPAWCPECLFLTRGKQRQMTDLHRRRGAADLEGEPSPGTKAAAIWQEGPS